MKLIDYGKYTYVYFKPQSRWDRCFIILRGWQRLNLNIEISVNGIFRKPVAYDHVLHGLVV